MLEKRRRGNYPLRRHARRAWGRAPVADCPASACGTSRRTCRRRNRLRARHSVVDAFASPRQAEERRPRRRAPRKHVPSSFARAIVRVRSLRRAFYASMVWDGSTRFPLVAIRKEQLTPSRLRCLVLTITPPKGSAPKIGTSSPAPRRRRWISCSRSATAPPAKPAHSGQGSP